MVMLCHIDPNVCCSCTIICFGASLALIGAILWGNGIENENESLNYNWTGPVILIVGATLMFSGMFYEQLRRRLKVNCVRERTPLEQVNRGFVDSELFVVLPDVRWQPPLQEQSPPAYVAVVTTQTGSHNTDGRRTVPCSVLPAESPPTYEEACLCSAPEPSST